MPERKFLSRSIWIFGFVLASLCIITTYILIKLHETTSLLLGAHQESFIRDTQNRAAMIEHFLKLRNADMQNPGILKSLDIFYRSQALGMSPEYGLSVSVSGIGDEFQRMLDYVKEHEKPVYSRIAYYDRLEQKIVADSGADNSKPLNEDVIAHLRLPRVGPHSTFSFCSAGTCATYLRESYFYKGEYKGELLFELNPESLLYQLGGRNPDSLDDFAGIVDRNGMLISGPAKLLGRNINEILDISIKEIQRFRIHETHLKYGDNGGPIVFAVSGTLPDGLQLVSVLDKRKYFAEASSNHWIFLVTTMSAGLFLISYVLFAGLRERYRIYQQLEESYAQLEQRVIDRTAELALSNTELKREMDVRRQAEEALVQSEERYRELVQNASDIIYSADSRGVFTYVNPQALKTTGFTESDLLGKSFGNFVVPEWRKHVADFYKRQIETNEPITYLEFPALTKTGEVIWIGQNTRILESDGSVTGFQSIARDITERKRMEEDLRKAKEAAEAGNRAKSEFLARMSHEIRTPINAIVGYTELMLDDILSADQREALETVKLSTNTLLALVDDILDLSRIEADKIELDETVFHLESLVMDACEIMRSRIFDKPTEILCDIGDIPEYVVGDPVRIRQVLMNLLGNAVKFTDRGEIITKISAISETESRIYIELIVQDTGIGIPEDMRASIFEPFTQAHKAISYHYGGAGLGLAICKRLIGLMDGEISVTGGPGQGSRFVIRIWLKRTDKEPVRKRAVPIQDLQGKCALLVDDNENALKILTNILNRVGIRCISVNNGFTALDVLADSSVDFALVDIRMPGMTGYELSFRINQDFSDKCPKVIALSSEPQWRQKDKLIQAGFDGYLLKPVRRDFLLSMICTVMGLSAKASQPVSRDFLKPRGAKNLKILLAEDNPINQKISLTMFHRMGLETDLAENGREAYEKAKKHRYDLIFMDVQMPDVDGLTATKMIREAGIDVPIIAITAAAMRSDRDECLKSGMTDYLAKPVKLNALREVFHRYCGLEKEVDVPIHLRILIGEKDESIVRELRRGIRDKIPAATIMPASQEVSIAVALGSLLPHVLILGPSVSHSFILNLSDIVKSDDRYEDIKFIVLVRSEEQQARLERSCSNARFLHESAIREELYSVIQSSFDTSYGLNMKSQTQSTRIKEAAQDLAMDVDEYLSLSCEFVDDVDGRLKKMETAFQQDDLEECRRIAHAIKGGAAEMMLKEIAESAASIEQCSKDGERNKIKEDLRLLQEAFYKFRELILTEVNKKPA